MSREEEMHAGRREMEDRRDPPASRRVVFNEADRVLAVAILEIMEQKMGMKFSEIRQRDKFLDKIEPMLASMHEAAEWRKSLYKWWLGMAGKFVLTVATMFLGFSILYGTVPAFHAVINAILKVGP